MTIDATLMFYTIFLETGNLIGIETLSSQDYALGHHSVKITEPLVLRWLTDTNHAGEVLFPLVKISYDNDQEVNFTGIPYIHP